MEEKEGEEETETERQTMKEKKRLSWRQVESYRFRGPQRGGASRAVMHPSPRAHQVAPETHALHAEWSLLQPKALFSWLYFPARPATALAGGRGPQDGRTGWEAGAAGSTRIESVLSFPTWPTQAKGMWVSVFVLGVSYSSGSECAHVCVSQGLWCLCECICLGAGRGCSMCVPVCVAHLHAPRNLPLPSLLAFPSRSIMSHRRNLGAETFREHVLMPRVPHGTAEEMLSGETRTDVHAAD